MPFFRFKKRTKHPNVKSHLLWQSQKVQVTRKAMKSIRLRVSEDGDLVVSCPHGLTDNEITHFLDARTTWITQQLQRVQDINQQRALRNSPQQICLWGQQFPITVSANINPPFEIDEHNARIELEKPIATQEQANNIHQQIWRDSLKSYMRQALPVWQDKMGVQVKFAGIKNMKTKWGSCNVTRHRIWLNLQLAQYPQICAEMVLVHELTHLLEASHNKRFYQLMDHFLPDWRIADKLLKNKEMSL